MIYLILLQECSTYRGGNHLIRTPNLLVLHHILVLLHCNNACRIDMNLLSEVMQNAEDNLKYFGDIIEHFYTLGSLCFSSTIAHKRLQALCFANHS
jgi:hypothetical protein